MPCRRGKPSEPTSWAASHHPNPPLGALPLDGEGLGGGDASRRAGRVMKTYPVDGAHARARTLRHNMTEAERRIWQILRLNRMKDYKFRCQVPIGHYIADFVCHE